MVQLAPPALGSRARDLIADTDLLIAGTWEPGASPIHVDATDPFTERPITQVCCAHERQVHTAITAARRAHDVGPWSAVTAADRSRLLHRALEATATAIATL